MTERAGRVETAALPRDLIPRAVSGAVLAAVALGGNWVGPLTFAALVLLIGIVMSWEWGRIVRGGAIDLLLAVHVVAIAAAAVLAARGSAGLGVMVVLAGAAIVLAMGPRAGAAISAAGVAYVGLPVVAMIWLRGGDAHGAWAILFVFAIVWTTDTFAYLCGRMIGGPKLWPALSPRKTWSGTLGGIAFAALAGALFAMLLPQPAPLAVASVAILLSIVSQIGDMAESALKRAFGVKNASELIPGHGGFMDRMDGVVTAASVAALLATARGAQTPAHGLLFWS